MQSLLKLSLKKSQMDKFSSPKEYLDQYASNSSIHGVKYIFGSSRKFRIFWAIAFILSIFGMSYYAYGVYRKFTISPDIGLTVHLISIREIPFPAITICSPLFARDSLANFSNFYSELSANNGKSPILSQIEQNYLAASVQACSPASANSVLKSCQNRTNFHTSKLLFNASLAVNEQFAACRYKKKYINCEDLLHRILTNNGYCYTLNMQLHTIFNRDVVSDDFDSYFRTKIAKSFENFNDTVDDNDENVQWTLDDGYSSDADDVFPIRALKINQLSVYMNLTETDTTNLCLSQGKGLDNFKEVS
jgi:hypothetical protein